MLEFIRGSLHAFFCMMGLLVWIGLFIILLSVLPGWLSALLFICTVMLIFALAIYRKLVV